MNVPRRKPRTAHIGIFGVGHHTYWDQFPGLRQELLAKMEILVNKVENCVYVPVQAVSPDSGKQVCFVSHGLKPERREVEIGEFNDEFIEVKNGLTEGERVLLRPPDQPEPSKAGPADKAPKKDKPSTPESSPVQTTKA